MATHAPSLMQQLKLISDEIKKLPMHEIADQLEFPNVEHQRKLLDKAAFEAEEALRHLDMYHAGVMRTYNISVGDAK